MSNDFSDVLVIIPAFNEESKISQVITDLQENGFSKIVVVDDGSSDNTIQIAESHKVTVLKHIVNIGVGGSTSTGLLYARKHKYQFAITMDADGQHSINDAVKIASELKNGSFDVIIGSRLQNMETENKTRFYGNILLDLMTMILSGKYVEDTQSGLRGFNKKVINIIKPKSSTYEVSSEIIIQAVQNNLKIKTIPIEAIYTQYSLKKGQKITNAVRLFRRLVVR